MNIDLPPELEDYRSQIESTVEPCIKIVAEPKNSMALWQSKFGGIPYLPKDMQYPRDTSARPLFLLAQLNFDELPRLSPFPEKGILQFYIADNDLYGLQFDSLTKQEDFRILYFPEVSKNKEKLVADFDFLPMFELVPVLVPCSLAFELDEKPISAVDHRFEAKVLNGIIPEPREKYYKILEQYDKLFSAIGHRIGGYPYFTQSDPRSNEKYSSDDFRLLLQIDTDWKADIMWGDAGVGNFFIKEADLKRCNFSDVMYNWDCS